MKRICAWCNKDMGEKEPLEDESVTHGMCMECLRRVSHEVPKTLSISDIPAIRPRLEGLASR